MTIEVFYRNRMKGRERESEKEIENSGNSWLRSFFWVIYSVYSHFNGIHRNRNDGERKKGVEIEFLYIKESTKSFLLLDSYRMEQITFLHVVIFSFSLFIFLNGRIYTLED